jgi:cytochrome P450
VSAAPRPMSREEAAALLGVPPDASGRAVRNAFLRAARLTHPDLRPEADEAERRAAAERFDALVQARAVLLTPARPVPSGPGIRPPAAPAPPPDLLTGLQQRGFANSLVLIALLSFLIVALVTLDSALRSQGASDGSSAPVVSSSPR